MASLALLGWSLAGLAVQSMDEYAVKAAYLYNFTRFTQWPETAFADAGSFSVCVLGDDPFGAALASLEGKTVEQRPLRVRRLARMGDYGQCQMLFISRSERHRLRPLLVELRDQPVLTVSDIEGFTQSGGMIELVDQDQRVGFAVNLGAVRRTGLDISSKLLRLAAAVFQ